MYNSPKAAHFVAVKDGEELPWNDKLGLVCRWQAAGIFAERGITDMMHVKISDLASAISVVNKTCQESDPAIAIKLADGAVSMQQEAEPEPTTEERLQAVADAAVALIAATNQVNRGIWQVPHAAMHGLMRALTDAGIDF